MRLPASLIPILAGLALCAAAAQAGQALPTSAWADPTRPAGAAAPEGTGPARALPAARAASAAPVAVPQLQSVQLGAGGQASALVDGRLLQVGDALGAARIAAIDADGLTLRDAQGRSQRLRLLSAAIAKQPGTEPARALAAVPGAGPTLSAGPATLGREGHTR
jgi:hypothetical protein